MVLNSLEKKVQDSSINIVPVEFVGLLNAKVQLTAKKSIIRRLEQRKALNPKSRRSKLEVCIDLLHTLHRNPSLKITPLMQKANVNYDVATQNLVFLISQKMVEERKSLSGNAVYSVSERGKKVLMYFNMFTNDFQLTELERGCKRVERNGA
jgi:predicted transcriptional regulator